MYSYLQIMFNIIPFILILFSFGVIIFILVRRFPEIAALEIDNIPEEREKKLKHHILAKRLERKGNMLKQFFIKIFRPIGKIFRERFLQGYKTILHYEGKYRKQKEPKTAKDFEQIENNIDNHFENAAELNKQESYHQAEQEYIQILRIDPKNIEAYFGLSDLYESKHDHSLVKETLEHILKLESENTRALMNLTQIYREEGDTNTALEYLQKALEIEPNHPRFLDALVELSIIKEDKLQAQKALERLIAVNSENQKIAQFEEQINLLHS